MSNVLVLDANQRSALAVIRSLGRLPEVTVFAADSSDSAIGEYSRFCSSYASHPSIQQDADNFLNWLKTYVVKNNIDIVFPSTEISSQLLLMNSQVLGDVKIPFASYDTVMSLADKGKLVSLATANGISVPKSTLYQSAQDVDMDKIRQYPVVIKPCLSKIWDNNQWLDTIVQIAHTPAELKSYLNSTPWLQRFEFMLQEFIEGRGAGVFALYNNGEPVAFFAHQRLREKPPEGGVSVLSTSVPLDPVLLENTQKLLGASQWHGVAMVEFRVATDGSPYLMEVNTRFWGTLQLAIDAGVDFPALLYQITLGETLVPPKAYQIGVKLRWFLGDLDSLYLTIKSRHFSSLEKLKRFFSFFIPDFKSTKHQVSRLEDFRPAVAELKQYLKNLSR